MKEVLQDYRLYSDLIRLNNDQYFQLSFTTPDVDEVFSAITNAKSYGNDRSCLFFLHNLKMNHQKQVFLTLKWLIVTHKLLNFTLYSQLVEDISLALQQMTPPLMSKPFDFYLNDNLLKVYTQYLQKLCTLKLTQSHIDSLPSRPQQQSELQFLRYNLLRFETQEFENLIPQFNGFFKDHYPLLTLYGKLIQNDLRKTLKDLKRDCRRQQEKMISDYELQKYQGLLNQISLTNPSSPSNDQYLTELDISTCKAEAFFFSNVKERVLQDQQVNQFKIY